ncbi:hypothetical protein D9611_008806 [Ephemerocybe angulata]|uniref:NAD(P)-binding protein n=1 Tax=Ephemerocybe angulata TaxID=980116 RepID=A0A8H5CDA4_9AGAR|nr:hypothetical protein D9611_008806 [Tulosesus angulatus]
MGVAQSFVQEAFPPKSTFSVDDIPDLTGKVVIVTGANTGVGKETAKALLSHNAKVYFASRSQEKGEKAIQDLKADTGKEGIYLKLDLGDLKSIKAAAEEFLSKESDLHILFNNAGVMLPPLSDVTADGYDLQFGTNVLGHFYFTKLVLPALLKGAKTSGDGTARVLNTSSGASLFASGIDFNTLKDGPARKKTFSGLLYNQSKLGNILFSNELARRYGDQGIVSAAMNPGNLNSELSRHMGAIGAFTLKLFLHPVPLGALTQLYAGTTAEGANLNGKYLGPWARVRTNPNPVASDAKLAGELWEWCEDQVANL